MTSRIIIMMISTSSQILSVGVPIRLLNIDHVDQVDPADQQCVASNHYLFHHSIYPYVVLRI
jgi:hypothetical protein